MRKGTEFAAGPVEYLVGATAGTVVKTAEFTGTRNARLRQLDGEVWAEPSARAGAPGRECSP